MRTSEETAALMETLRQSQAQFPTIPKAHRANAGSYSYAYADLADIVTAIRPILAAHNLVVTQVVEHVDGVDLLTTRLAQTEIGQWIEGSMRLFEFSTPQAQGSAISYARRYAYCSLLGIISDEDDDGAAAQHSQRRVREAFPGATDEPPWEPNTPTTTPAVNERMNKRVFALCVSNGLTAAKEASRILGAQIRDTRTLTQDQAKKVLDTLQSEGVEFSN